MSNISKKKSQKIIDELSKYLGINKKEQNIFHLSHINENEIKLSLANSNTKETLEPWFIVDENDEVKIMLYVKTLADFFQHAQKIQQNNFELRLEKAIYQKFPIDFNDVWVVAMDEIKNQLSNGVKEFNIDLDKLVNNIHKQYPNLFLDIKQMLQKGKSNERL
ncbi:DUF2603 domain-containing protein [Campylobacter peloridis]|uniref:DUF2603 domain-containing protein n=1 Tax=Campylobacter peloridis TaxID=488546 RepID=UPI001C736D69|nr:DUF2603 domain-containing protein [Campylobacter peloridis]MBX1885417.1 DUF2603 domain-containing protein [Campylobacter peloridis]MBX2078378.1 DUF2603 domain-containing protein [Campylobacter peloridis]